MKKLGIFVGIGLVCSACAGISESGDEEWLSQGVGVGGVGAGGGVFQTGPYGCRFDPYIPPGTGGTLADKPDYVITAFRDTTIEKTAPDTRFGNDTTCSVRGGASERSCLLEFSMNNVPTDLVVTKACLQLSIADDSTRQFSPRRLLQPWTESAGTWNTRQIGGLWQLPGAKGTADRDPADLAIIPGSVTGTIAVWFNPGVVQSWIRDPSTNYGITIAESAVTNGISFYSREAESALRPRLLFE